MEQPKFMGDTTWAGRQKAVVSFYHCPLLMVTSGSETSLLIPVVPAHFTSSSLTVSQDDAVTLH